MFLLSKLRLFFTIVIIMVIFLAVPQVAFSASTSSFNHTMIETLKIFGINIGMSDVDPRTIIARLIRVAMGFVGIIMVLMILSSGALMMTSGGDEDKIKKAKSTFFNAVIGLIIIFSAYSIVTFAINLFVVSNVK